MGLFHRLSISTEGDLQPTEAMAGVSCVFCGVRSGPWQFACAAGRVKASKPCDAACPLCHLASHLERSCIDDEAMLVWLPEVSQPALNTILREIHIQLSGLGNSLVHGVRLREDTATRHPLFHVRTAIAARASAAAERLGTSSPSELASALRRLSPAAQTHREVLLDGLRVLPLGRFFSGESGTDVYPKIVDLWRTQSAAGSVGKGP